MERRKDALEMPKKEQFNEQSVYKNDIITLDIRDIHRDGMGVGIYAHFTPEGRFKRPIAIFVEDAFPGDTLQVKILKVMKNRAYGKIELIIKPSLGRLDPCTDNICSHAKKCGGCIFQEYAYSHQLEFKTKMVRDALTRIAHCKEPPVLDIIGMELPKHYRNKAKFVVDQRNGAVALGFYAQRSHDFVWIRNCNIHHPFSNLFLGYVSKISMKKGMKTPFDSLIHIILKCGFFTGESMLVFVMKNDDFSEKDKVAWVELFLSEHEFTTIVLNINTSNSNVILGESFETLHGSGYIHEVIGHIRYRISPRAFFQVNPIQTKVMYDTIRDFGNFTGAESVIDAHTGIGGIGLYIAQHVKEVIGVETVPEAIKDAIHNATLNGIENARFIEGAAEEIIPDMLKNGATPDVLIFDPPRKGCAEPLLNAAITAEIPKIIYASCDPATLARDIAILSSGGYHLEKVQPIDMFPQTGHVEVVCLLVKNSAIPLKC